MSAENREIVVFQGVGRVRVHTSVAEEIRMIRESAAVCHLAGMCVVRMDGADTTDYLHRRLSGNVKAMRVGDTIHTALLTGEGRMISDLHLLREADNSYVAVAQPAARDLLAQQIERYVIMEKVEVRDISAEAEVYGVYGPRADAVLPALVVSEANVPATLSPWRDAGASGIVVIATSVCASKVLDSLIKAATAVGGGICGHDAWDAVRIAEAVPLFGADVTATTIPLEAGLDAAIDFDKGCFPGQEVVARIRNLGHPAKVLVQLAFDPCSSVMPGDVLRAGDKVQGSLTSVSGHEPNRRLALGYVKWDQREPGAEIDCVTHTKCVARGCVLRTAGWPAG